MKIERKRLLRCLNSAMVSLLIVGVSILNISLPNAAAADKTAAQKVVKATDGTKVADSQNNAPDAVENPQDVAAQYQAAAITEKANSPAPQTTKTDSSGKTLLYAGIGIAAVAAVALAAGGSGGSSPEPDPPTPINPPVGADLDGDNWHGQLKLVDGYTEDVTASVHQNGTQLEITTTTAQKYGQKFIGKIDRSANILVKEQTTGEIWSTLYNKARWNMIALHDFVHNVHTTDRLILTREAKTTPDT
ncbi:MAG: hypothetical protein Q8R88_04880 [Desulfoprunum sp.]|nr:hypothetical protein [Desulfoprunum sp.]